MEQATITNTFTGGNFAITHDDISVNGSFRKSDATGKMIEFHFDGVVEVSGGDGRAFSGNFDGSNINYYSVPIGKSQAIAEVVESVYAQLTA